MALKVLDEASQILVNKSIQTGIETGLNRLETQLPQCGFACH